MSFANTQLINRLNEDIASLSRPLGRKTDAGASGAYTVRPAWEDDPKKGFRSSRDFLMMVMDAGHNRAHATEDERLRFLQAVGSDEARGISDPAGGFLVPEGFSPNLLKVMAEDDPLAPLTTRIPMKSPTVKLPARVDKNHSNSVSGGFTLSRKPETVAATASAMTFEQVTLAAQTLFGLSYATEEILTDSPISFAAIIAASFGEQFGAHLFDERINGTGVGEYLGVLNSPALITVSKETGQAANSIVYENIIKMRSRCWGYGKAVWIANHDALPSLMLLNQTVGTAGLTVWQPSAREDHPDTLLGRPLIFSEYPKTVGTVGDIILGNWSEYLEGQLEPLKSAESVHVRFQNHERSFKFWMRNSGMPWWRTVMTPRNGSTLAPWVVLATRA